MIPRRFLAGILVVLCGCGGGGSDVKTAPVSGTVTVDGKPVEGLLVRFEPAAAEGSMKEGWSDSSGVTDAQGRYRLATPTGQSGALIGPHGVTISEAPTAEMVDATTEGAAAPKTKPKPGLPARYNAQSTLKFVVPKEGTKEADFGLASK